MRQNYVARHAHIRVLDQAVVLKPHGNIMGGDETDELEALITMFDSENVPCLVVNLVDVGMINSLGLSRLIQAHIKFARRKARVHLCQLDAKIQNIFVITRLSLVFPIYPDEKAALGACAGPVTE